MNTGTNLAWACVEDQYIAQSNMQPEYCASFPFFPSVQHKQQWALLQREEQLAELERALSDARAALHDQREHELRLQAEVEQLKIREAKDRKTIQKLLVLTESAAAATQPTLPKGMAGV